MGISSKLNCQGGAKHSNVGGVKKYVDTAFDDIQKVANNLEKLLELNETFQNLNGIYLGAYATSPIRRPDGGLLQNGDHYLNTGTSLLYVHLDGNWIYHSIFFTQSSLNQAVAQGPYNIWIAYADDNVGNGISLNPDGKSYTGFANNQITNVVAVHDASVFTWSKSIGVDGVNSYIHIAYANSPDGTTDFSTVGGNYLGIYVDVNVAASTDPTLYNWNLIKGADGLSGNTGLSGVDGTSVIVTDLGGGRISISDGVSTVFLDDGEIPTLIDNGDGTYTITSGIESVTVSDGLTPLNGIDYFDGNNGDYISFVYANVPKGAAAPVIDAGSGTWNGTVETYPTGASWGDNATFVEGETTYLSTNRYAHNIANDTWALRNNVWSIPSIFIDKPDDASQGQIKSFAFLRSATQPLVAPTGGSFLNPNPTTGGWSDGIPAGTLPIWVVTAVFTSDGAAPQNAGDPVPWSTPVLLAENGIGFKHRFSANETGPWSDTPSTTDEWMITSVRDSAGIWVDDTTNPIRIKGETGASLQTSVRSFAFKRSSDPVFVETPTGGDFSSPNPVDDVVTGWTDGIPTGTDRLYVSTRLFTSDGLTPQHSAWAESQVFSYNGTGFRTRFSVDGITNWHLEPTVFDVYMWPQTSSDGGVTWTDVGDPIKIKGESGFGSVELDFSPGLIGGAADFIFTLNATAGGTVTNSEIRIQGSKFQHPDGSERTTQTDTQVNTPYGDTVAGKFYLMWTDESNVTRFNLSIGNATNIVPIRINAANDGWEVFDNLGAFEAFTPIITDCIIATATASNATGGLSSISPLVSGVAGAGGVGDVGASGNSVAQLTIYRRSATLPATPTGGSFSFDNLLITPPTDWSAAVVAGSEPLYASVGIASTTGTSGVDSGIVWGAPDIIAQDGSTGPTGATGLQGLQGDAGTDGIAGVNNYFHIAYADDITGTGFSQDPTGKTHIGTYVDAIEADAVSGDALWNWQLVQGENGANGDQGIPGIDGATGETSYLHIAYANTATGSSGFSTTDSVNKSYIGQYTDFISADSNDSTFYSWTLIRGTDGTDGTNGINGDDGITGRSVFQGNIYRRSATAPATPSANSGSFDFGTNVLTPPANWDSFVPAGTNPLYVSTATFSIVGDTGVDSTQTWTTPEIAYQNGTNSIYVNKFETVTEQNDFIVESGSKSVSADSYSGSNAIELSSDVDSSSDDSSGNGNTAYLTIPEDLALLFAGQNVVVSFIVKQGSDPSANFSVAYSTADNGNSGFHSFVPTATYTKFSFDYLVPLPNLNGTDIIIFNADESGTNKQILIDDVKVVIKGDAGADGLSTYMYNVFQRASSAPATPSGGSYNFGTNNGAPPSGWTNDAPAGTNPLYISSALASVTGATGTDSGLTWTTPVIFARDGVVGPDGDRGTKHYYTTTTANGWSSTIANDFIIAQGDTKSVWDVVTISDSANGFSETRYWSGSAWLTISEVIDGNLIVIGTISANAIVANSITANEIAANAITANEIAANSITATEIAANTITAGQISANAINTSELNANSVTAVKIATDSVIARHILAGEINATHIATESLTAELISSDAIQARHLSISSDSAENGNDSGVSMVLNPYAASPFTITDSGGDLVFAIQLQDDQPRATVVGSASIGFVDTADAITDAVKKSINPFYLGAGASSIGATGDLTNGQIRTVSINPGEAGLVSGSLVLAASGWEGGNTSANYTTPVWGIRVQNVTTGDYLIGTAANAVNYTGTSSNFPEGEDFLENWISSYNININIGFVDESPNANVNNSYRLTVTYVSGTPTAITQSLFNLSTPSVSLGNSLDTVGGNGGFSWTDKDTGFTVKSGTRFLNASSTTLISFSDAFTTIWSATATCNSTQNNQWDYGTITGFGNGSISIRNNDLSSHTFRWIATGIV